jgi:hypothetical protein
MLQSLPYLGQKMKQSTLSDLDENGVGICYYLIEGNKICGARLKHHQKGLIDYWYCPKCDSEVSKC